MPGVTTTSSFGTAQTETQNQSYVAPVAQPVPAPKQSDPLKPGYATTEFWMATVIPTILAILATFNIGHIDTTNPRIEGEIHLAAYLMAGLGYAFYAISRGHMKKGAAIAAAIKQVFDSNIPDIANNLAQVIPARMNVQLQHYADAVMQHDPQFSEQQLEDLSNIVGGLVTHPRTKAEIASTVKEAVDEAVRSALSSADVPEKEQEVARDIKEIEDVVEGATATTDPPSVDTNAGDAAGFTAPQFS